MAQCTYTTKDVLSMLDEDSEDDFEGYIDEEMLIGMKTLMLRLRAVVIVTMKRKWKRI